MSTRANIIIKDRYDKLYFYRHSDGYPNGVTPSLDKFVDLLREDVIRNNVSQSAGHLILIGMAEYNKMPVFDFKRTQLPNGDVHLDGDVESYHPSKGHYGFMDWKVGAYEPTVGLHGDIEHLYVIDLEAMEWYEVERDEWRLWDDAEGFYNMN